MPAGMTLQAEPSERDGLVTQLKDELEWTKSSLQQSRNINIGLQTTVTDRDRTLDQLRRELQEKQTLVSSTQNALEMTRMQLRADFGTQHAKTENALAAMQKELQQTKRALAESQVQHGKSVTWLQEQVDILFKEKEQWKLQWVLHRAACRDLEKELENLKCVASTRLNTIQQQKKANDKLEDRLRENKPRMAVENENRDLWRRILRTTAGRECVRLLRENRELRERGIALGERVDALEQESKGRKRGLCKGCAMFMGEDESEQESEGGILLSSEHVQTNYAPRDDADACHNEAPQGNGGHRLQRDENRQCDDNTQNDQDAQHENTSTDNSELRKSNEALIGAIDELGELYDSSSSSRSTLHVGMSRTKPLRSGPTPSPNKSDQDERVVSSSSPEARIKEAEVAPLQISVRAKAGLSE
jgi:hypothetical protein